MTKLYICSFLIMYMKVLKDECLCCRCMMDSDDEVRDRATFYMNVLQQKQKALNAAYIFNGTVFV